MRMHPMRRHAGVIGENPIARLVLGRVEVQQMAFYSVARPVHASPLFARKPTGVLYARVKQSMPTSLRAPPSGYIRLMRPSPLCEWPAWRMYSLCLSL
jgi:hypothetical protein